jgi:hypothetical protein
MKTSTPPGTTGSSLIVNGTYIKITKSENLLYVQHARTIRGEINNVLGITVITFTNLDNTTVDVSFPTQFSTSAGDIISDVYVLPLQCKSLVLKSNADGGGGV